MSFLLVLLQLFAIPCLFAAVWKKKTGETLCLSLGLMMVFLFVFYCINNLIIGLVLLSILLLAAYLFSITWIVKKKEWKTFCSCFFSNGFFVGLLFIILLRVYVDGFFPYLWDELRLWSALPKTLYISDQLQLGAEALVFESMQNYLPGIGLLQYYFERTHGEFSEHVIYLVYGVLGGAALLPAVEKGEYKRKIEIPLFSMAIFILPLCVYNSHSIADYSFYYRTLFIDGLLGLLFAYSLYCGYDYKSGWFYSIRYIVSICILMLLKESGMLIATLSLIFFAVCNFGKRKGPKKNLTAMLVMVFSLMWIFTIKFTWQNLLRMNQVEATGSWLSIGFLKDLIIHPTEKQTAIMQTFINALGKTNIIEVPKSGIGVSWGIISVIFLVLSVAFSFIVRKKRPLRAVFAAYVMNIAYAASLLVLFIHWGALRSYARYINTGVLAFLAFFFMLTVSVFFERRKEPKKKRCYFFTAAGLYSVLIVFVYVAFTFPMNGVAQTYYIERENANKIRECIKTDYGRESKRDLVNIFLISDGSRDHVINHHQVYNQLLTDGIIVRNWCYDTSLASESENNISYMKDKLMKAPFGVYDYIYIADISPDNNYLAEEYSDCFEGADSIEEKQLYRIEYDGNNILFKKIII